MPNTRSRTPLFSLFDQDADSRDNISVTTPSRRQLRPKLSSIFACETRLAPAIADETTISTIADSDQLPCTSSPEVQEKVEGLMCVLLARPLEQLEVRHNAALLEIFEAYRGLIDENHQLHLQLLELSNGKGTKKEALHCDEKRTQYLLESRRPCGIDHAETGDFVSFQTSSRTFPKSLLDCEDDNDDEDQAGEDYDIVDDQKETIFEFLDQSRLFGDRVLSNQRATLRRRSPAQALPPFPSSAGNLTATLIGLKKKPSMISVHDDLPFGSPPSRAASCRTHVHLSHSKAKKPVHSKRLLARHKPDPSPLQFNTNTSFVSLTDGAKESKIPSPVYPYGTRPRRQRDSSSSFLASASSMSKPHEQPRFLSDNSSSIAISSSRKPVDQVEPYSGIHDCSKAAFV